MDLFFLHPHHKQNILSANTVCSYLHVIIIHDQSKTIAIINLLVVVIFFVMFANHVAKPFARSKLDQIRFGENLLIYHTKEQRAPTGISLERPFLIYCQCQGDTIFIFILQQTKSKSKCCNAYCIFRGHHDLINLLCMVVCHYTNIFSLVDENAI